MYSIHCIHAFVTCNTVKHRSNHSHRLSLVVEISNRELAALNVLMDKVSDKRNE